MRSIPGMVEQGFLALKEVAVLLGRKPAHVRYLLSGTAPRVPRISHGRAGRVQLIPRAAVLAWMQAGHLPDHKDDK